MNAKSQLQQSLTAVREEMARLSKALELEKDPVRHAQLVAEMTELTASLGLNLTAPQIGDGPVVTEHTTKTETKVETKTETETVSPAPAAKPGIFTRMKNWIKRNPWWTAAIVAAVGGAVYVALRVKVVSPEVVQGLFKKSAEVVTDAAPTVIEVPVQAEPGVVMTILNKTGEVLSKAAHTVGDVAVAAKDAVVGFFSSTPTAEVATTMVEVPVDSTVVVVAAHA